MELLIMEPFLFLTSSWLAKTNCHLEVKPILSLRLRPTAMIASRWVGSDTVSQTEILSARGRIFRTAPLTIIPNSPKASPEKTYDNITMLEKNNALFGTFCVQIGQLLEAPSVLIRAIKLWLWKLIWYRSLIQWAIQGTDCRVRHIFWPAIKWQFFSKCARDLKFFF